MVPKKEPPKGPTCANFSHLMKECRDLPSGYDYDDLDTPAKKLKEQPGCGRCQVDKGPAMTRMDCDPAPGRHFGYIIPKTDISCGSIGQCPCCLDTPEGPVPIVRYKILSWKH